MFTVCPKCALTLVVTAADLRVAQGFVRCGRCSNVFNALARLSEDRGAATSSQPALTPPPPPSPPPREEAHGRVNQPFAADDADIPESALEFNPASTDVSKVFVQPPPNPEWQAATGTFKSLILDSKNTAPSGNQHAAISGDDAQVDVELDAELLGDTSRMRRPEFPRTGAAPAPAPTAPLQTAPSSSTQEIVQGDGITPKPDPTPSRRSSAAAKTANTASSAVETRPRAQARTSDRSALDTAAADIAKSLIRPGRGSVAAVDSAPATPSAPFWSIGTGVLVVLLGVQIVHHFRNDLATISWMHGPLTSLYATLGVSLVPKWNVAAYEVRQLGASTDADRPGQITVRTSVKNRGQPRPFPLLRVTLQDRFGNRIAARDVPPASYLPHAVSTSTFMAAGQRIDAEMTFVDPGSSAVGFEVDACLPYPGGGINCANDIVTP